MRLPTRNEALWFVKGIAEKVGEGVRWFARKLGRGALYLCLFFWSIVFRVLLFALTIAPIGLPVLALAGLWCNWPTIEKGLGSLRDGNAIASGLSLLGSAGLLSWFITKMGKRAWKRFVKICRAAKSVLVIKGWTSEWTSLEGLETNLRDYTKHAPREVWTSLKHAKLLAISLPLGVLLVALNAIFDPKQAEAPGQTDDTGQTDDPVQPIYRYVAVVGARETIRLFLKPGAVFSLAHVEDAQPRNGEGICLGVPQRKWLHEFRKAIENCIKEDPTDDGSKPVFKVTAYASIAPMHVDGDTSERLNCKVANWRAAAVGAYLINPNEEGPGTRWRCEDVKNAFNQTEPNDDNQCGKHYEVPENQDGNPFRVEVHQWSMPNGMAEERPVDDGERPSPRRYDVEIMNRVVHIEVPKSFCRPSARSESSG